MIPRPNSLKKKAKAELKSRTFMVVTILGLISWRSLYQAVYSFQTMDTSDILGIPLFYFRFMVPLGFITFALEESSNSS
jgi:hypothetical protein